MRRRDFITLLSSAVAAWPLAAIAQPSDRPRRIGVLRPIAATDPDAKRNTEGHQQALRDLGWVEGRNVKIESRFSSVDADQLKMAAQEFVELQPDVILVGSTLALAALHCEIGRAHV